MKRSLEKNRERVDQEVESVNEVEIVRIDRDQRSVKEKIVIAIAIDEAAVVIGKKIISKLGNIKGIYLSEFCFPDLSFLA